MKRFLVFMYDRYYPSGGSGDMVGHFDTMERAMRFVSERGAESDFLEIMDQEQIVTTLHWRWYDETNKRHYYDAGQTSRVELSSEEPSDSARGDEVTQRPRCSVCKDSHPVDGCDACGDDPNDDVAL